MVAISVDADLKKAVKGLKRYQRRQIPYAASQALNDTAENVRQALIREWNTSFNVRAKGLARAMWRKKFANKHNLEAAVFDRLKRFFVMLQAQGGTKSPFSSSNLIIPTRAIKRLASGKISKRRQPRAIKNAFIADLRGRGPALWQRQRNGSLKMLYVLEPRVQIKRAFNMEGRSRRTVRDRFYGHMRRRLIRALETAR